MDSEANAGESDDAFVACLKKGRPAGKAFGRWLGDFLGSEVSHKLLPTEARLLTACEKGAVCEPADDRRVRAGFIRFLALGGDESAPVHEIGVHLAGAVIEGDLDLRHCTCAGRLTLEDCRLDGTVDMQDAILGVLKFTRSRFKEILGNRAKVTGALWLNHVTVRKRIEFSGLQIKGRLDCSLSRLWGGMNAPGAKIGGDAIFHGVHASGALSLVNAQLGGVLDVTGAWIIPRDRVTPLSLSRASIKGNAEFSRAVIRCRETDGSGKAVDAQNLKCQGAVTFTSGFRARGEVCFNGAKLFKTLDFSNGLYNNAGGYAIRAERAEIAGIIYLRTASPSPEVRQFRAFGCVSLLATACGEIDASGGLFYNCDERGNSYTALELRLVEVSGSIRLQNSGFSMFRAFGAVDLFSARIGQHLYCGGGRFINRGDTSINAQAVKIAGCAFLTGANDDGLNKAGLAELGFFSSGTVDFTAASIGLQFSCLGGKFFNIIESTREHGICAMALTLSAAQIEDTLFLGREYDDNILPDFYGSIDLTGASVRVLIDDGFLGAQDQAWRPVVYAGGRQLKCQLRLDQFSYERLKGAEGCDDFWRLKWLRSQPESDLVDEFKPQPFEQMTTVLRAMGYGDSADEIALAKCKHERNASVRRSVRSIEQFPFPSGLARGAQSWKLMTGVWSLFKAGLEFCFVDVFIGYGYRLSRGVLILLLLMGLFTAADYRAFQLGGIVPADKTVRDDPHAAHCLNWTVAACPVSKDILPPYNALVYSADLMVPIIGFGEKSAWTAGEAWVYDLQLLATIFGWVGGALLGAVLTGVLSKE